MMVPPNSSWTVGIIPILFRLYLQRLGSYKSEISLIHHHCIVCRHFFIPSLYRCSFLQVRRTATARIKKWHNFRVLKNSMAICRVRHKGWTDATGGRIVKIELYIACWRHGWRQISTGTLPPSSFIFSVFSHRAPCLTLMTNPGLCEAFAIVRRSKRNVVARVRHKG